MTIAVRRLGPGDEGVLATIAARAVALDVTFAEAPDQPLAQADATAYLADPAVLHWIAEEDGDLLGTLHCYVLRRRAGDAREVLLFEIGVDEAQRRRGAGSLLIAALRAWMEDEEVAVAWVLADNPDAVAFYARCGFVEDEEQATGMLLDLST